LQRVLRRGVPVVLALVLAAGVGQRVIRAVAERRALARLPAAEPGRPNVLLLVLDTVRAWSLGLYGYVRPTTPKLQEWSARGALFERVLTAAPWTTPSHAVMFTGRYPTELSVSWDRPLDGTFPTLAEVLKRAGYATAGFVGNFTQAGSPTGLDRGFLHYEDYPVTLISMLRRTGLLRRLFALDRVGRLVGRRPMVEATAAERLNRDLLGWVAERSGRPWFAFVNYNEAHGPYLPPAPYDTLYLPGPAPAVDRYWDNMVRAYGPPPVPIEDLAISVDAYDGAITYLDREIDALLRELDSKSLLANTIVVVTSDHGELFGEHGVIAHGNSLFLPVLRVPLLLIAPGRIPSGIKIGSLASLRDLPATLLELAGIPNPDMPGHSLAGLWGPAGPGSVTDTLFSFVEYNRRLPKWPPSPVLKGSLQSIVLDSLEYIRNGDGAEELYHLGRDPWQVRNLVSDSTYRADLVRYRAALRAIPH
jgi:arylsulfatase A-like enzyme